MKIAECEWVVWSSCLNNIPQHRWLKQQTFIFLLLRRLEVQGQGTSRHGFWWGFSFWLAVDFFLLVFTWLLCTMQVLGSPPLLIRTTSLISLEPHSLSHLTIITSLKVLSTNTVTLEIKDSIQEFWRGHNSVHNNKLKSTVI